MPPIWTTNEQLTTSDIKKATYDICRRKIQVLSRDRHIDMAGLNQFGIPNPPLANWIFNGRFVSTQKDVHFHTIEQHKHGQYNGRVCWLLAKRVELHFLHIYYQLVKLGPWPYGSWIYNCLCNQCISPLMLRVRTSIGARCTTLCDLYGIYFISLDVSDLSF
jgi:hypothetical protein